MPKILYEDRNEFQLKSLKYLTGKNQPAMIRFLVDRGIIKSEKGARLILVAFVVICLAASYFILNAAFGSKPIIDENGREITVEEFLERNSSRAK